MSTVTERFFLLSQDMFAVVGFDGFFKSLNPAWETALGFSIQELISTQWSGLISPEDHPLAYSLFHPHQSNIVKHVGSEQLSEAVRQLGFYWLLLNEPPKP